jgi:alkyl sulfatase BDS1-like metallo-beta-lactamase superfamily hydrolase
VPERFSPEWIAALDDAARGLPGSDDRFVIQQVVTGDEETAWHVVLDDEGVRVRPGRDDAPDITFTQDRATAEAIATGELSAGAALTAGRLTVRGATARLTEHRDTLAALDEALARA